MLPTKPLYCVRFALLSNVAFTPAQIVNALKPGLEAAGAIVYQTPAIKVYKPAFQIFNEGPYEGSTEKFVRMFVSGPSGVGKNVTQIVGEPKGSHPIVEQRNPVISAFAWNIGPPPDMTPTQLGDLIFQLRLKSPLYDSDKYIGAGWPALASEWSETLVKLPPYPDRPALPAVLTPIAPTPTPAPKPPSHLTIPETVITAPIVKPPTPDPLTPTTDTNPSWLWPVVAGVVGIGLFAIMAEEDRHKGH
jgi:hypothetical protein